MQALLLFPQPCLFETITYGYLTPKRHIPEESRTFLLSKFLFFSVSFVNVYNSPIRKYSGMPVHSI